MYEPYKKIVVKHCARVKTKEELALLTRIMDRDEVPCLQWANGILFESRVGEGELAESERLEGTLHFIFVYFCDMPEYRSVIEGVSENYDLKVPVLDFTDDPLYSTLATWIRNQGQIYALT